MGFDEAAEWNLITCSVEVVGLAGLFLSGYICDIIHGAEISFFFFLITAFLSLGDKNTLCCHESSPVQVQGISRHVHQKAKTAKSP